MITNDCLRDALPRAYFQQGLALNDLGKAQWIICTRQSLAQAEKKKRIFQNNL